MKDILLAKTHPYRIFEGASTRYAEGYEALQCDIKTILDSPRGQMLGKPNFGSYLHEALGDMNDTTLCQKVEYEAKRAIMDVYPKTEVEASAEVDGDKVKVHIHMTIFEYSEALDFVYEYERSTNG